MLKSCDKHRTFPDIENCSDCKESYEIVLMRWFGMKAVENFRLNYQREICLPAMRVLKK